jgi:hypothetical protein
MCRLLDGWSRIETADGVVLHPETGLEHTVVRVRLRLPLQPLARRADAYLHELERGFAHVRIGPVERFLTFEGEHAGQIVLGAKSPGRPPVEVVLALVAAEERAWLIESTCRAEDRMSPTREVVRLLAELSFLGLGASRRRRYDYSAPPGWRPVPGPHQTLWLCPGYPRVQGLIQLFDASPRQHALPRPTDVVLLQDATLVERRDAGTELLGTRLRGRVTAYGRARDPSLSLESYEAILHDERFIYRARLNARRDVLEMALPAFNALLHSIEPVPFPRPLVASEISQLWNE